MRQGQAHIKARRAEEQARKEAMRRDAQAHVRRGREEEQDRSSEANGADEGGGREGGEGETGEKVQPRSMGSMSVEAWG